MLCCHLSLVTAVLSYSCLSEKYRPGIDYLESQDLIGFLLREVITEAVELVSLELHGYISRSTIYYGLAQVKITLT